MKMAEEKPKKKAKKTTGKKRKAVKKPSEKTVKSVAKNAAKKQPKPKKEEKPFSFSEEYQKALEKLTPKRRRFVEEYLIDLVGTQAAIRAGFSVKNADKIASQLLGDTRVSTCIKMAMAERSKRTGITADRVLEELAKIAFVNPDDFIDLNEGTVMSGSHRNDTAAIASVKVKTIPTENGDIVEREVKLLDKVKALEMAGKHVGMFTDKLEVNLTTCIAARMKAAKERAKNGK
jgi:phage terminase small subunit